MLTRIVLQKISDNITESSNCFSQLLDFTDIVESYEVEIGQIIEEYGLKVKNSSLIKCLLNMVRIYL